jgi:site-specific recombinase XerD
VRHSVLGGRAQIVKFDRQPDVFVYRQLIKGSKSYYHQQLSALDVKSALREAEDVFLKLQSELEVDGTKKLSSMPLEDVLKGWIRVKEGKQSAGLIGEDALRGCIAHLMGSIKEYLLTYKKLNKVSDLKKDTYMDYVNWRMTEGWKKSNVSGKPSPVKESTVKRDLTHLKDWYQNYLIPRGYVDSMPTLERIIIRQDQLDANPPIPLSPDWTLIHNYLKTWAEDGASHPNPRVEYWRQLFRHFCLISYNAGTRPKELVGKIEKQRQPTADGSYVIKEVLKGGLRWDDVTVEMATHKTESGKEFEVAEATLHIRYTKTGVPRDVPCNTGAFFIRWREFCNEWRKRNGFSPLKSTDYVFFNPNSGKPYTYTQFTNAWNAMRTALEDKLSPIRSEQKYTMYSMRSSYITNQIDEGKDVYLVKQLTGHSLEILVRHYDRSNVKRRSAEATARSYAKQKKNDKSIDLESLGEVVGKPQQHQRVTVISDNNKRAAGRRKAGSKLSTK